MWVTPELSTKSGDRVVEVADEVKERYSWTVAETVMLAPAVSV